MSQSRPGRLPSLGDGLWGRRLLAGAVGAAVAALLAAGLFRLVAAEPHDLGFAVWVVTGLHLLSKRWRPRRDGRLRWHNRVAGRDAVEAGLVARRSLAGWVDLLGDALVTVAIAGALATVLPNEEWWGAAGRALLVASAAVLAGRAGYGAVRFTGRLALTASGIRHGRRAYGWTNIDLVVPHRSDGRIDGVRLRPATWRSTDPAPVVGGRDTAVPEERLVAAIEHFRHRPETLAVGLPVTAPEPAG
ncbi:hypothetical protein K7640_07120 [Micromonospora sp. PLK6-60]|uniref:hypothetical protein n=1 Tax=Micromonospora sp. PLK6-60 TaxID=2873383 RepID=UPI001CA76A93|nr:hypothetical protein [Micromonospora sp. PLK6-60]MBY8871615.1 hypothetical protein [Micromonospora sp. PLK6-60]